MKSILFAIGFFLLGISIGQIRLERYKAYTTELYYSLKESDRLIEENEMSLEILERTLEDIRSLSL